MKYLNTYKTFENTNIFESLSEDDIIEEIVNGMEKYLFPILRKDGFEFVRERMRYNHEVRYSVRLPDKDYKKLNDDRFYKYEINNKIRKVLPVEIDNFYNESIYDKSVMMKFDIYLYKYNIQEFVIKYLPHLIKDYEKLNTIDSRLKKVYPDALDLGLL